MHGHSETKEEKETQSQSTHHSRLPAISSRKFTYVGGELSIAPLPNGDIALLQHNMLQIFNADLTESKAEHKLDGKFFRFVICPNGDLTANSTDHSNNRVLLDTYTLEIKKTFDYSISTCWLGEGYLGSACPINKSQYTIINCAAQKLDAIPVYDSATHECKTTLNIQAQLSEAVPHDRVGSAFYLPNNTIALELIPNFGGNSSHKIVLFKYQEEKLSDVKLLELGLKEGHSVRIYPISADRFLTMATIFHGPRTSLQLWDAHTSEKIGMPIFYRESYDFSQVLSDGSIICVRSNGNDSSQITLIDSKSLAMRTHDVGRAIVGMRVLTSDQVVIISKPIGWYKKFSEEGRTIEFDVYIVDIEQLFSKKLTLAREMADSLTCLPKPLVNEIAKYVGSDYSFTKSPITGGLFLPPPPKTVEEKILAQIKKYEIIIFQLIKFFADKNNEDCSLLLAKMKVAFKKSKVDLGEFENNLQLLCKNFDESHIATRMPKLKNLIAGLNQLKMNIEELRMQQPEAEKRMMLAG